jgi:molybdopterin synthase sulfur carrier subunit
MQVLYFASIREQLGVESEEVGLIPEIASVQGLIDHLCETRDERWRNALRRPNLLISVNQELAGLDMSLNSTDEIAFFPPVTGG